MRICKAGIFLVKPGALPGENHHAAPKKKAPRKLTAAQRRKVEQLREKLNESNRKKLNGNLPIGAEIR